jgi:hypothetical protein
MRQNKNQESINFELDRYFKEARDTKCPKSMKKNLYAQTINKKANNWLNQRMVLAGVSMALVATFIIKLNHYQANIEEVNLRNAQLLQAQNELNVAMHYMNRVSFKSLASVKSKGLQPAVIMPMAKSLASI